MLVVGLVAAGSGCRPARSSGSPVSDLSGMGEARLSAGDKVVGTVLGDTEQLSPSPGSVGLGDPRRVPTPCAHIPGSRPSRS